MREAQLASAFNEKDAIYGNCDAQGLDARQLTVYRSDCTEVGAPEVDGLPNGTRFGEGQSGSRTREPPPRCIFLCSFCRQKFGRECRRGLTTLDCISILVLSRQSSFFRKLRIFWRRELDAAPAKP